MPRGSFARTVRRAAESEASVSYFVPDTSVTRPVVSCPLVAADVTKSKRPLRTNGSFRANLSLFHGVAASPRSVFLWFSNTGATPREAQVYDNLGQILRNGRTTKQKS